MPLIKIDLTEAGSGGDVSPRHAEEGSYLFQVKDSKIVEIKNGDNKGKKQILFIVASPKVKGATYPYYVQPFGKAAFKLRLLAEACGVAIKPGAVGNFNTDKLHGKYFGGDLVDRTYEKDGQTKLSSEIAGIYHRSELDEDDDTPAETEDEEDTPAAADDDDTAEVDLDNI